MNGRLRRLVAGIGIRRALLAGALVTLIAAGLYVPARYLWAGYQFRAAQEALENLRYAEAESHIAACLQVWPEDYQVLLLGARTARLAGSTEEAHRRLNTCQRIIGQATDPIILERTLIQAQLGELKMGQEFFLAQKVQQDDPETAWILDAMWRGYIRLFRLYAAEKILSDLLERRPNDMDALMARAWARERLSFQEQAIADYRRVLEINPNHQEALLRLPELLVAGSPAEAVERFEQLRGQHPDNRAVLLGLARGWVKVGRIDEAKGLLDELLAEYPEDFSVHVERGILALQIGDAAKAEPLLRRATDYAPRDYQAVFSLSQCLFQIGKEAEAKQYQQLAQEIAQDLKRLEELSFTLQNRPYDPDLRCEIAQIFLRQGDEQQGFQYLKAALQSDPNHATTHRALADFYESKGQPARAAAHRLKAGQAAPVTPRKESP